MLQLRLAELTVGLRDEKTETEGAKVTRFNHDRPSWSDRFMG